MRSLSRTGRPLTNRYWPSALARDSVGSAAKPAMAKPSRPPCTSSALARNSAPSTSASRASRPAHGEAAHHLADGLAFGAVALEELQPGRRGIEQVAHLDPGSLAERC